jgi:hypothetical protein
MLLPQAESFRPTSGCAVLGDGLVGFHFHEPGRRRGHLRIVGSRMSGCGVVFARRFARIVRIIAVCIVATAYGQPSKWLDRDAQFLLDAGLAGDIEVGMSVDQIAARVGQEWLTLRATFPEGRFQPVLEVASPWVDNGPALSARVTASNCYHGFFVGPIWVFDRRFKTAEGVGIGSTLGDLRRGYGVDALKLSVGGEEGSPPSARLDRIGLIFSLDRASFEDASAIVSVGVMPQARSSIRPCA